MFTYTEIIEMYEVGLISKIEANDFISGLNMGSDYYTYKNVK
jgi:hypothetical protein